MCVCVLVWLFQSICVGEWGVHCQYIYMDLLTFFFFGSFFALVFLPLG